MMTKQSRGILWLGWTALLLATPAATAAAQAVPAPAAPPPSASAPPGGVAPAQSASETKLLPPPPDGYEYVLTPTAPAEPQEELSSRLESVDTRLSELRAERQRGSLAGPIAMMATGYGATFISGLIALRTLAAAEDVEHGDYWDDWRDYDVNDDGVVDHDDEKTYRRLALGFGALSVASLGVGIGGSVLFANRMRERNRNLPEIRSLQRERWELRRQLEYGTNLTHGGMQLSLTGRF